MAFLSEKKYETYQLRVKKIMGDYMRVKYNARFTLDKETWSVKIEESGTVLDTVRKEFLAEARDAYLKTMATPTPSGTELKGIYFYLRLSEMLELPILLYEPRGVPATLLEENVRLIRAYCKQRFLYITNSVGIDVCNGVRGLISQIILEDHPDPAGDATYQKLRKDDRAVAGYDFRDPSPRIFHPWTFFPFSLPRFCDVKLTIYNKMGAPVYVHNFKNMKPGAYLQKNRFEQQKWRAVDNDGNEVESGYYVYTLETDLFKKTGPIRVSQLRKLPDGKASIFNSFYNISSVPTTQPDQPDQLPYGERGVFGCADKGRLFICYTEGYKEKQWLVNLGTKDQNQIKALQWMTNVIAEAAVSYSLAR